MNTKFKVGDEVEIITPGHSLLKEGTRATIKSVSADDGGVWLTSDAIKELRLSDVFAVFSRLRVVNPAPTYLPRKVVIFEDGMTVTAKLLEGKKLIREASAKCSPDDTFDFGIGADLAFTRLGMKPQKPLFRLEDYRGKYAMHCPTPESRLRFRQFLNSNGRKWDSGDSYLDWPKFDRSGADTCYEFNIGYYDTKDWCDQNGYTVLSFDDFFWPEYVPTCRFSLKKFCLDKYNAYNDNVVALMHDAELEWPFECDGKEVVNGKVGFYDSHPDWEVKR